VATCPGRCRGVPLSDAHACPASTDGPAAPPHTNRMETNVLWTILIVLAIIALAIWILTRVRGGRV